jgi:hypothetical protein
MALLSKQHRTQLEATYVLLEGDTTTLEKFEKIKSLLLGINPTLDAKLTQAGKALSHVKAAVAGDIIHLTGHALPELTPEDKKRKKALLLFVSSWRSLKSEVGKVRGYYESSTTNAASTSTAGSVAKTALFAKGPFGIITLAAVAIVGVGLLLRQATTTVSIENVGCPPIMVPAQLPFPIPGLKLPTSPIIAGVPSTATLPTLPIAVRAVGSTISATIFGQTGSYTLPGRVTDIRFDNASLLNQTTQLKLSSTRAHSLVVECR